MDGLIARTVAATLRQMSGWGMLWDDESQASDELLSLAARVEAMEPGEMPCPMCEEIECDGDCPLAPVRAQATSS